jgi:hypothetical protein
MNKKQKLSGLLIGTLVTTSFITGVFASEKISAVKAYLNTALTVQVNGTVLQPKESDGSRIYPIVYNNRTYLPAKAIAESLGATVTYDGTGDGTVKISSSADDENAGKPTKDGEPSNSTPTPAPATSENNSSADGSLSSPIPLNQKCTWSSTYKYKDTSYSGTYSLTLKDATPITRDEIKDLGLRPDSDEDIEYMMITAKWEVNDAKLSSLPSEYNGSVSLSNLWSPYFAGVKTTEGKSIIGSRDYGFDGNIRDKIREAASSKKMTVGSTASYSAEGKILLPILKGATNYMVLQDSGLNLTNPDKAKFYFKLK